MHFIQILLEQKKGKTTILLLSQVVRKKEAIPATRSFSPSKRFCCFLPLNFR